MPNSIVRRSSQPCTLPRHRAAGIALLAVFVCFLAAPDAHDAFLTTPPLAIKALHADDSPTPAAKAASEAVKIVVDYQRDQGKARVEVVGLPAVVVEKLANAQLGDASWRQLLRISVAGDAGLPAMLGEYSVDLRQRKLVFEPRFPLQPGLKYRALWIPGGLPGIVTIPGNRQTHEFGLPERKPTAPTVVQNIYPSRNVLPENQLKFYIHFSAPMSRGEAYGRVRLLDAEGEKIEYPFLELGEELWDRSGTRFTLFFDPGRIKRGLQPRALYGPALEEGKSYTLVIDRDWLDAEGNPLKESVRKSFKVIEPDDVQPNHKKWQIAAPPVGTQRALTIRFDEPLDRAMLERVLIVRDAAGKELNGTIRIDREETRWQFVPEQPWQAGRYAIDADTTLEDLAGNSLGRPFEVDVFESVDRRIESETVSLPFEVQTP
jgi:hypothetical protein